MICLVEMLRARQVQAPQAEHERERHETEQDQRVAPIEPAAWLLQVGVGRVRRQPRRPAGTRGTGSTIVVGRRRPLRRRICLELAHLARRERQADREPGDDREHDGDEQDQEPDAGIGEECALEEGVLHHWQPADARVDHALRDERPVLGVDPVHVREEDDRDGAVQPRPGAAREEEQRTEREGRKEIAFVDARREHEEGDRQDQRGHHHAAQVVTAGNLPQRQQRDGDEEQGPDLLPGQREAAGHEADGGVVAPVQRVAKTAPRVPPQAEGVDRESGVRVRRVTQLADQARHRVGGRQEAEAALHVRSGGDRRPQRHPERDEQQREGRDPGSQRCDDPQSDAPAVELRIGRATEQVALDADDGDDRDEERELELDEHRDHGADGGRLGPAAGEEVDRAQQRKRADRVDLAPHRRVEDRTRIEEVDRRRRQAGALGADPEARAFDQLVPPAPDHREEEPGDADVCQDPRDLQQGAGGVDAGDGRERRADLPEHPEDIQVAGRIIAEVAGLVELGWSDAC